MLFIFTYRIIHFTDRVFCFLLQLLFIMDVFFDDLTDSQLIEAMEEFELCETMDAYERSVEPMAIEEDELDLPMEMDEDDHPMDTDEINQSGGNPLFAFHLQPTQPRRHWRNVVDKQVYQANVRQMREATPRDNLGQQMTGALHQAVRERIRTDPTLQPHHSLHFVLQATTNQFNHPFQSTTFKLQEFEDNSDRLGTYLQALGDKLNSNESFDVDTPLHLELTFIRTPNPGSGNGKRYRPASAAVRKIAKKSLTLIRNQDDLCAARAIVNMKAWADRNQGDLEAYQDYKNMKRGRPIQKRRAQELHRLSGVPEGPCGLEEIAKFQAILPEYQIKVMTVDPPYGIIYKGPVVSNKLILLVKTDGHYDGCKSFAGFLSKSYYCHDCDKGYNVESVAHHPCDGKWCAACETKACPGFLAAKTTSRNPQPSTPCSLCKRSFYGDSCLAAHYRQEGKTKPLCQRKKKCTTCSKQYTTDKKHKCGWGPCPYCDEEVKIDSHQCYIQPEKWDCDAPRLKTVPLDKVGDRVIMKMNARNQTAQVQCQPPLLVYADYEAVTGQDGLQTPIMVCAESEEEDETHTFYGENCTETFFEYLDQCCEDCDGDDRQVIVIFHNFKSYDGMFILQHLYQTHREVTNQVTVGVKILTLQSDRLTFKDSLCFLPFPLASFPATFGLTELKKGFFPHLFNTLDNQEYVGPMPPLETYDPEGMAPKKKSEFLTWYTQHCQREYEFNLRQEMEDYCISDVKLLKAGCQKFQAEFRKEAGFNPLEKCLTIASACHRFWRKKLLKPKTIASEPVQGWRGVTSTQSHKALQWLAWQEHQRRRTYLEQTEREDQEVDEMMAAAYPDTLIPGITGDFIRHASNGGEVRLSGCLVDGYDETTRTVYEFHGCLWHGCTRCYPKRWQSSHAHPDRTFAELRENTTRKEEKLIAAGMSLVVIWECEWDRQIKTNPELQVFLQNLSIVSPLEPRDAFFGGRTNAATLHAEADPYQGEEIRYVDVTSLYPMVNKYDEYPIGHPTIITHPENQDINQYFGLAKVEVLAPRQLFHPVLPHRSNGKLTFPLCKTCVMEEMKKPLTERSYHCDHSDEERMFVGTWCTPELLQAQDEGYVIRRIHEVWHFAPNQRKRGLFADYVNTWLRLKQESSGYPSWAQTPAQKAEFVRLYQEKEGVTLDPDQIVKNPGRKATSKLSLNSYWGKFGENLLKAMTYTVTNPAELYELISDPLLNINTVRVCTDDRLEVAVTPLKQDLADNGKINIFIAAFTTCHARLRLYQHLKTVGERALYYDTDSVIYKWRPGDTDIPLGDYLGEMTNELEGGDYIVDFSSAGPKNYGYRTHQGKVCCKVRGFSLNNTRGSQQLNYEVMRANLLEELQNPSEERREIAVVNPHFFTRDPLTKDIRVRPRTKQYGVVFDKRVVDPLTFRSYPYGYGQLEE